MNHLIKRQLKMKLSVDVFSNSPYKNELLNWGKHYKARDSDRDSGDRSFFIFHFKNSAVHITSYELLTYDNNVFPLNWSLSVSNDNETWTNISNVDEPLCSYQYIHRESELMDYCNYSEKKTFDAINLQGFYQFVKYQITKNSYYGTYEWYDQFSIYGFELNGDYLITPRKIRTLRCSILPRNNILIMSCVYLVSN